jgi:hypothetical protein
MGRPKGSKNKVKRGRPISDFVRPAVVSGRVPLKKRIEALEVRIAQLEGVAPANVVSDESSLSVAAQPEISPAVISEGYIVNRLPQGNGAVRYEVRSADGAVLVGGLVGSGAAVVRDQTPDGKSDHFSCANGTTMSISLRGVIHYEGDWQGA